MSDPDPSRPSMAPLPPPDRSPAGSVAEQRVDTTSPGATDDHRRRTIELVSAIIIGIAAILTALATYQGGQLDGEVGAKSNEALDLTVRANDAFNEASALEAIERDWIFGWIIELENGTPAADYLADAMPDEVFALALEWSEAPDDIIDPFSREAEQAYPAYASLPSSQARELADELDLFAECALFEAQVAEARSDDFGLSTVFLAISLVVAGIAALLRRQAAQFIVLAVSVGALLFGASILVLAQDEAGTRDTVAQDFFGEDQPGGAPALADDQCPTG